MRTISRSKIMSSFIKKAKLKHNDVFDYSLVEYIDSRTKVKIVCKEHGVFYQTPGNHLKGQRCPFCYGNFKSNTIEFVEKSKLKHANKYDYSLVNYKNNRCKVDIICKEHGIFNQSPNRHLNGQGCPKCDKSFKLDVIKFIEKSKVKHGDKYDYSLVEYVNNITPISIICDIHGVFSQVARNHLNGYGCKICAGNAKSSTVDFIYKSNIIHNYKYDYSLVEYKNAINKVDIICSEHGEFKQAPNKHLNGRGCPACGLKYGFMENDWLDSVCVKKADRQISIGKYVVDGLDRENNIIYEFNGDFWHGNPDIFESDVVNNVIGKTFGELYKNTIIKEEYLKSIGYKLISIWESEFLKKYKK